MRFLAIILIGSGISILSFAQQLTAPVQLTSTFMSAFHPVSSGIYRGSRPDVAGVKYLADIGIRTVLDLEGDQEVVNREAKIAKAFGVHLISMPMSGFWTPDDKEVDQILQILNDSSNRPIYIHCQHGHDRTGLIVGLYRVFYQNWTPKRAYGEMLDSDFHPLLIFLNHYYEEKTGFED